MAVRYIKEIGLVIQAYNLENFHLLVKSRIFQLSAQRQIINILGLLCLLESAVLLKHKY